MLTPLRRFGDKGEGIAADFLKKKGYAILARQVVIGKLGELDLVCRHVRTLVFVEVKTRSDRQYGLPEESIGEWKRARFRRSIEAWLQQHQLTHADIRADVVAIEMGKGEPVIRHLEGVEL